MDTLLWNIDGKHGWRWERQYRLMTQQWIWVEYFEIKSILGFSFYHQCQLRIKQNSYHEMEMGINAFQRFVVHSEWFRFYWNWSLPVLLLYNWRSLLLLLVVRLKSSIWRSLLLNISWNDFQGFLMTYVRILYRLSVSFLWHMYDYSKLQSATICNAVLHP